MKTHAFEKLSSALTSSSQLADGLPIGARNDVFVHQRAMRFADKVDAQGGLKLLALADRLAQIVHRRTAGCGVCHLLVRSEAVEI